MQVILNNFKMETVLVQINNNKAYRLLEDLEDLHIIKVLEKNIQPKQKLSQGRNEWNNRSI